ncbi:MAG TPA: hypothetical protein VGG34_05150 [Opitutaceae bacterium]|jgi:hypothetical protein
MYQVKSFVIDSNTQNLDSIVNTWLTANPSITNPQITFQRPDGQSTIWIVIMYQPS